MKINTMKYFLFDSIKDLKRNITEIIFSLIMISLAFFILDILYVRY